VRKIASNPSSFYRKWIHASGEGLEDGELRRVREVLVYSMSSEKKVLGWSFFEPRDLSPETLQRLKNRIEAAQNGETFTIIVPSSARSRLSKEFVESLSPRLIVKESSFFSISLMGGYFRIRDRARVVSVDDSPLLLKIIKRILEQSGSFEVMASVLDPLTAEKTIESIKPDVITMDIQMPGMSGVELVRRLREVTDIPIIMVSSLTMQDGSQVFEALNSGAFDYVQKPLKDDFTEFQAQLTERALSGIYARGRENLAINRASFISTRAERIQFDSRVIWLIGASTGGTQALTQIMKRLPSSIPPTLIVQHIPPVFSKAFAESLSALCPFTVKEAENGELIKNDCVYIAPGGLQMGVERSALGTRIALADSTPVNRFKPSVDYLFTSAANVLSTPIVAGILTGMGSDGAQGLLNLKKLGATTFAQDEATSAVYGMPRSAFELGATDQVLPLDSIADFLIRHSAIQTNPVMMSRSSS
jgi:two-component system chemotaxis response regulator CheB